jgi:hypothetical protein
MGRLLQVLPDAAPPDAATDGLMTDYSRDLLNWASFAIGIISLLISVAGLVYGVLSWREAGKAKTAASAARDAAEETRAEARRRFETFTAARLRGHVQQARQHLHRREWGKAAIHLEAAGEDVGHFAVQDPTWKQAADDLLGMANSCSGWDVKPPKKGYPARWNLLLNDVLGRLPLYQRPT